MCALHAQIAPSSTSQKLRLFQIASVAFSFKRVLGSRAMPNFASHFWKIKISLSFFEEKKTLAVPALFSIKVLLAFNLEREQRN